MKEKTSLIIGVFGSIELIYFLIKKPTTETILGFEINGWLYFSIWILIVTITLNKFIRENKKKLSFPR